MNETTTASAATTVMPVGDDSELPHIIIVGGGAGGLELATRLGNKLGRKREGEDSLIERARTHIWKPLLHEIAAGSMDTRSTSSNTRRRATGTGSSSATAR